MSSNIFWPECCEEQTSKSKDKNKEKACVRNNTERRKGLAINNANSIHGKVHVPVKNTAAFAIYRDDDEENVRSRSRDKKKDLCNKKLKPKRVKENSEKVLTVERSGSPFFLHMPER